MPSRWVKRCLVLPMVGVLSAVACGTGSTQSAAGSVKVLGPWSGADQASLMAVFALFERQTGIHVIYESTQDEDATLTTRVTAGSPPDVAASPSPQVLAGFARRGKLIALNDAANMTDLQANYAKSWIDLGETLKDGKLYQVFSWATMKGLIWYDPKNFQAKAYSVPNSWDNLLNLQGTIKDSGLTPWCIGLESGSATGAPGTDWIEEIVLSQSGPDVYDKWVAGTQKWSSPEITNAFQTWGKILGTNNANVNGGKAGMLKTNVNDGATGMFDNPAKCYMHNQAPFITTYFTSANPSLKPVTDFNFFPLPDITGQFSRAHVISGDSWSMFHDTLQARKLIHYLTTAQAQTIWVKRGGRISPNKQTSLDAYTEPISRETAQILVNTGIARFDAIDNMPAAMKTAALQSVIEYISNQNALDKILAGDDKIQATAYK